MLELLGERLQSEKAGKLRASFFWAGGLLGQEPGRGGWEFGGGGAAGSLMVKYVEVRRCRDAGVREKRQRACFAVRGRKSGGAGGIRTGGWGD